MKTAYIRLFLLKLLVTNVLYVVTTAKSKSLELLILYTSLSCILTTHIPRVNCDIFNSNDTISWPSYYCRNQFYVALIKFHVTECTKRSKWKIVFLGVTDREPCCWKCLRNIILRTKKSNSFLEFVIFCSDMFLENRLKYITGYYRPLKSLFSSMNFTCL